MNLGLLAGLFIHFFGLSLIAVGGFMATLPGMYAYLVETTGLLTPAKFAATVAFGQSLPGPNVLVAAVLGWAAGGPWTCAATFIGTCIPFTCLAILAGRFVRKHSDSLYVKAYKSGMAPVAIGLLFATGYILLHGNLDNIKILLWAAIVTVIVWRTRFPLFALIIFGGVLGASGLLS